MRYTDTRYVFTVFFLLFVHLYRPLYSSLKYRTISTYLTISKTMITKNYYGENIVTIIILLLVSSNYK